MVASPGWYIKLKCVRSSSTTRSGTETCTPLRIKAANEVDAVDQFVAAFNKCWFCRRGRALTARSLVGLV